MKNTNEIATALGLTTRRVGQLVEAGVILPGDDGRADPEVSRSRYQTFARRDVHELAELTAEAERAGLAAAKAAERLNERATLADAKRAAKLAADFDAAGKLLEACQPEHRRPILRHARESVVGEIVVRALEVAQRHGVAR